MKHYSLAIGLVAILLAGGCGNKTDTSNEAQNEQPPHEEMEHNRSGVVPKHLKEASNPKFAVGDKAIIETDHMPGMKGAEATIVDAYDTTAYEVSYTPTTGGPKVENHKWVIHKEIKDTNDEPLQTGDEVTIEADHMEGMKGAIGKIDSAVKTTVYMIDYTPTDGGERVVNHKWVTDDELTKIE